jgi:predicted nucleic acid-binding protein
MIAADTSTWIAYLQGERGQDTELLDRALSDKQVVMAPVVLTELLSDPKLDHHVGRTLSALPLMPIQDGFWERAGRLRAEVLARRRKARLGDALIAQVCLDHQTHLITRDGDFRAFAAAAELSLVIAPSAK